MVYMNKIILIIFTVFISIFIVGCSFEKVPYMTSGFKNKFGHNVDENNNNKNVFENKKLQLK